MCFEYQGIIFNGKKVLNFSQMLTVRPGGVAPPPLTVSLTVKYLLFLLTTSLINVCKKSQVQSINILHQETIGPKVLDNGWDFD